MAKFLPLDDKLYDYVLAHSLREHAVAKALRQHTATMPNHRMQVSPDQGQFLAFLVKMLQAKRLIEVGVFTGYSSLCMALALEADGFILACDVSEEWTKVGQAYWQKAGVSDKIQLRVAPALATLQQCLKEGQAGTYDFAFIDADKVNYPNYVEACYQLLRKGGVIAIDNVLWSGRVCEGADLDEDTRVIKDLNLKLSNDGRFDITLLTISDGLTLLLKR